MNRIKILMVLGNTGMGGTQAFILNVLHQIDLNQFQIDLAVNQEKRDGISDEVRKLGCTIYVLPYFKVLNYFTYSKAWKYFLINHHYDIIHAHSTNSASVYLSLAKKVGCITIAHSHSAGYRGNALERCIKQLFSKKTRKVADYWFACSKQAAIRLFGKSFSINPNFFIVPNAFDAINYRFNEDKRKEIRSQLGISSDEFVCGHVGTFSPPKNHTFLLEVFNEVLRVKPNARLICCGDGYLREGIIKKIDSLNIRDRVILTGVVMNAYDYMMAMDVFLFPSLFEGFPMSVVEAEASGLPIYMSDVITKEVDLTDCVNRCSLQSSASEWAKKICDAGFHDRQIYNEIVAESEYNIHNSISKLETLYRGMVGF